MLPKDPVMLLSYTNTKLRDFYPSLQAFCEAEEVDMQQMIEKLRMIDYHYDEKRNQFV